MKVSSRESVGAKTNNILVTGLQSLSAKALVEMPQASTMKRDIHRQKAKSPPAEPATIQNINLLHPWNSTGGVNHDSGVAAGANRIIVFAADDATSHLATSDTWFMDGNFKSAPALFVQVYIIRAKLDEGAISCVYCFLPGKGRILYTELFMAVQRRIQQLGYAYNLQNVTVDYEQAAYDAFRNVFGQQINVGGCFYHTFLR